MTTGDWIALAALISPLIGGVLGVWLRVGRILERFDTVIGDVRQQKKRIDHVEKRVTKLEVRST